MYMHAQQGLLPRLIRSRTHKKQPHVAVWNELYSFDLHIIFLEVPLTITNCNQLPLYTQSLLKQLTLHILSVCDRKIPDKNSAIAM
jgi:amino acid transporter